jgi:hypothetical protein
LHEKTCLVFVPVPVLLVVLLLLLHHYHNNMTEEDRVHLPDAMLLSGDNSWNRTDDVAAAKIIHCDMSY